MDRVRPRGGLDGLDVAQVDEPEVDDVDGDLRVEAGNEAGRVGCYAELGGTFACAYVRAYTNGVVYEWDEAKNRSNLRKHGVDFADAVLALEDEHALTIPDDESDAEERFVTLGVDGLERLLVVAYTWREENIRVISARKATRRERTAYEGER